MTSGSLLLDLLACAMALPADMFVSDFFFCVSHGLNIFSRAVQFNLHFVPYRSFTFDYVDAEETRENKLVGCTEQ